MLPEYSPDELDKTRALLLGHERHEKVEGAKRRAAKGARLAAIAIPPPPSIEIVGIAEIEECARALVRETEYENALDILNPHGKTTAIAAES